MAYEQYSNAAQTTTTGSINNSSNPVTFSVSVATAFPAIGNFRVIIDSEILIVTSVSGTSFTASRAAEGTSIASHSSGATVTCILTAASLQQLVTDRTLFGTFSTLPAAGVAGRSFTATDNGYEGLDNGTTWSWWYHGHPVTIPPSSSWTWENQAAATVDQTTGSIRLKNATTTSNANINAYYRPVPGSTPYTLEWLFYPFLDQGSQSNSGGPILRDSSGKYLYWRFQGNAGSNNIQYSSMSSYTTVVSNLQNYSGQYLYSPIWMKMVDDGTNRNWYIGPNQFNPNLLLQESRTNYLTAAYYGMAMNPDSHAIGLELVHLVGG